MKALRTLLADVLFQLMLMGHFELIHFTLKLTLSVTSVVQALVVGAILSRDGSPWFGVNLEELDFVSFFESFTALACIPWCWTVGMSMIAAAERLGLKELRCRRRVQKRKRTSGLRKLKKHKWHLNKRGIFLLIFLGSGYGVHGMDQQQFSQFMEGFGKFIQRQEMLGQATNSLAGSIPDMLKEAVASASSSSSSAGVAKGLESASKILKNPEYFDASDPGSWIA